MFRDRGPNTSLGFGVHAGHLPVSPHDEVEQGSPESGAVARHLNESPLKKFFATAGLTLVGAGVSVALLRGGARKGIRWAARRAADQGGMYERGMKAFREAQGVLDEYEGIVRTKGRGQDIKAGKVVHFDDPTQDVAIKKHGFYFTQGEQERMRNLGMEVPADWSMRDEMQQRMVKLARRLPYELPAAYTTQRLFSDRLLGVEHDTEVNWKNPVDIVGDFANQSLKNLAFAFIPFEAGVGSAKHGWRSALASSSDANLHGARKAARDVVVDINHSLQFIGQQASDLITEGVKYSRHTTGAMATAITRTSTQQKSLVDHLHNMRHGTDGFVGWLKRVQKGEETFSPLGQMRSIHREFKHEMRQPITPVPSQTKIEQIAASSARLRGPKGEFTEGAFYREWASEEYRQMFGRKLTQLGVDEKEAFRFANLADFSTPVRLGQQTHIGKRIKFGKRPVREGEDQWQEAFQRRLEPEFTGHAKPISENLSDALRFTDREFIRSQDFLQQKVKAAWNQTYKGAVLPGARQALGTRRMPYERFGADMGDEAAEFLVRRSAERVGVPLHSPLGARRSTSELRVDLRKIGLDPRNKQELRSFLIDQGDISAPWNPRGFNFLGMRPMSVQDALDRKVFEDSPWGEEVQRLAAGMRRQDWDPFMLERTRVGGLFETAHGDVLDVSPIAQSLKRTMDVVAREFHIPLIKVKPLEMLGYGLRRDTDFDSLIQFTARGRQPFLPQEGQAAAAGHLWFRGTRGRGRVARIAETEGGRFEAGFLEGLYRPIDPGTRDMAGRAVRYAIGDSGRRDVLYTSTRRQQIADVFDYTQDQPASAWNSVRRFFGRKDDLRNSAVFAQRLMARGSGWKGTQLPDDPALVAEGADSLFRSWRNASFSSGLARHGKEMDSLGKMLRIQGEDIVDMDASTLQAHIRRLMAEDLGAGTPRSVQQALGKAQRQLLRPWGEIENLQAFDQPVSRAMQSAGVHRRIDEARRDLMRYQAIRENISGGPEEFRDFTMKLQRDINKLLTQEGVISGREAAEARAAIGDLFVRFAGIRGGRQSQRSLQEDTLDILERLRASTPGSTVESNFRQILEDTATHRASGAVMGRLKKHLGTTGYHYQGLDFNPFGGDMAFVPTFGTAFQRHPFRATRSALGVNTWNDPEAFSGAGMLPTHIFDRMNRAGTLLNLGVDQAAYSGPLRMFFEGVIGKRIFPLYMAGTTFMTIDRTLGGHIYNEFDAHGERIYTPFFMGLVGEGAAAAQVGLAGVTPWGMTAGEKREQLEGDVPIRRGRFWPFGHTPWKGDQVLYYRPSWKRRLDAGYQYTSQTYGSPIERWLYGYDYSPLRPFDPYRWERENYFERPYPTTGEYFTGPWGPATGFLNLTAGRLLKPPVSMHEEALEAGLSRLQPVGAGGMAMSSVPIPRGAGGIPGEGVPDRRGMPQGVGIEGYGGGPATSQLAAAAGTPAYLSGTRAAHQETLALNEPYIAAAGGPPATPYHVTGAAYPFVQTGGTMASPYRPTGVMRAEEPISQMGINYQLRQQAYLMQEYAGIYGFTFGAMRDRLGMGQLRYKSERPILSAASEGYGVRRQFWDLQLGGFGDFVTPFEGQHGTIELSELIRRYIPRPRRQDYINPIPNVMGHEHPWLPGADYMIDFHLGDPYAAISEGEMRLPGIGYERFRRLHPDETGRYGRIDRLRILGDVAPYSAEFKQTAAELEREGMSPQERGIYEETMRRTEEMQTRHQFYPYQYRYSSAEEQDMGRFEFGLRRAGEWFAHQDTYLHTKLLPHRTAVEDWERRNVYGSSFPMWQRPIEDFVKPTFYKAAGRDPVRAGATMAFLGHMMGVTPQSRAVARTVGGITGFGLSTGARAQEAVTGERFMPRHRRREIAVEEYMDVLEYTRARRGFEIAREQGDMSVAQHFRQQMQSTMYGADIYNASPDQLERAIPRRKREHFREFLQAPPEERGDILSTAGRLERRIYQAAWGMRVERRPELEEFFEDRQLPPSEWEGWDPRVNMDNVAIKVIQQQGLHASNMGYYPQQVREANIMNPSYPDITAGTPNVRAELERLMRARQMSGDVRKIRTPFPGVRVQVHSGVGA